MKWFASETVLGCVELTPKLVEAYRSASGSTDRKGEYEASGSVCVLASDLLEDGRRLLPSWVDTETRFLIVRDVPISATVRLPTLLRLHKPDQRLFLTDDPGSVRRWIIASLRTRPFEGIIDAYVIDRTLTVFLGDLTIRDFPVDQVPSLEPLSQHELEDFEIDVDGSFLLWASSDIHLGPSQILQAVDPSELADIEIQRYQVENTAAALKHMREAQGLTQAQIRGLSERQVSRLENGRSRLTADAARKWARALDRELADFLGELGRLLTYWQSQGPKETPVSELRGFLADLENDFSREPS